jgi:heme-degrading monooxygenase HmoA
MYARSLTMYFQPGELDEALRIARESILPELREHAGDQGTIELFDRSTHKRVVITLWQTEADLRASGESASHHKTQARSAKHSHHFAATPPVVEIYECEWHPVIG